MIRRMVVLVASVFLGLGVTVAPAWAHEALEASEPAAEAVLVSAPQQVRLTFSGNVVDAAPTVVLRDGAGADVPAAEPLVDGPTITLPIESQLANGRYAVEWRIVSSDGDPVSGTFAFTVAAPEAVAPLPSPATGQPVPDVETSTQVAIGDDMEDMGNPTVGPWPAVGATVLAVVVAVLAIRRRGRPDR